MNVVGKLEYKGVTQQITDSFKKQEFVIEFAENPQYPEFVKFELIQDNCGKIDSFNIGDSISVEFNLTGRKWDDPKGGVKYFNTLKAWRVSSDLSDHVSDNEQAAASEGDDLPF